MRKIINILLAVLLVAFYSCKKQDVLETTSEQTLTLKGGEEIVETEDEDEDEDDGTIIVETEDEDEDEDDGTVVADTEDEDGEDGTVVDTDESNNESDDGDDSGDHL